MSYNPINIIKHQKKSSRKNIIRVMDIIYKMINEHRPLSFSSIANEARVSRSFLYKHEEIRKIIQFYRTNDIPDDIEEYRDKLLAKNNELKNELFMLEQQYRQLTIDAED